MNINKIAKVSHEINRAYCKAIGDDSQVAWEDAPEWQRESAINGVKFHLETPSASPAESHASWLAEKAADGWTWGPVKDPENKEHPCFCRYTELPAEQRAKDHLFIAVVAQLRDQIPTTKEAETPPGYGATCV